MSSTFSSATEEGPIIFGKLVTNLYGSAEQNQSRVSKNYGLYLRTGINYSLHLPCILLSNVLGRKSRWKLGGEHPTSSLDGAAQVEYVVKSNELLLSAVRAL